MTILLALLLVVAAATAVLNGGSSTSDASSKQAVVSDAFGKQSASAPEQPAAPAPAAPAQPPAPEPAAPSQPAAPAPAPGTPTRVAFLGDGYTSGSAQGGQGTANYTAVLAGRGLQVTTDAVYGSGYVTGQALPTRVQKVVAGNPQVVVVSAGRADDMGQPAAVGNAAKQVYQELKTGLPQAKVVVIGPMWLGDNVPPRLLAVRDAIRGAATEAGLPFVDPIADRWFIGSDQDGIASNRLDLNDKGQQRLADLVGDALKRSGATG